MNQIKNPTQHSMTRRSAAHDYTRPGIYHITMHVADGLGQVLGTVVGSLSAPDGSADAPRTALSPIGQMVQHELLHSIHAHYPMVFVQDYVVMPDHLHCIVVVQNLILSTTGRRQTLGQVIAGFKKGCNRRYWDLTGQAISSTPAGSIPAGSTPAGSGGTAAHCVSSGSPAGSPAGTLAGKKVPSDATTGRQPLFSLGYCDVMPVDAAQLATQRAYIAANPRSRLLRATHPALRVQRGVVTTALTPSALCGFLQRECPAAIATPEVLATIKSQLLLSESTTDGRLLVACDAFGDTTLLQRPLLPVVCHRKDGARFSQQKERCLAEAAKGAILVSARISPKEREIITECVSHGFPVVTIHDNGFADRYHPSEQRLDLCAAGRLLILTPWQYHYRPKAEAITVAQCKTMNCVAQALCRKKDSWWKEN